MCGDSKFGDKCNSSGALKSKKYYKYSIGYSFDFDKKCKTLYRSIVVGSIMYIIYYA